MRSESTLCGEKEKLIPNSREAAWIGLTCSILGADCGGEPWVRGTERVSEKIARSFVSQPSVGCAKAASPGGLAATILVKGFSVSRS